MNKKTTPVSPFSTGGGGVNFELLVAVQFLISLLKQEIPRGLPGGVIQEVKLQQRNLNCPLDDIVIKCKSTVSISTLYLQVKHDITFGNNAVFIEVIQQSWKQISNTAFNEENDSIGLAISEACNNSTIKDHITGLNGLISWARGCLTGQSFYQKVSAFKTKKKILQAFEVGIALVLGKKPTKNDVHKLIKHFVVIPYDFDSSAGREYIACQNDLYSLVKDNDIRNAGSLGAVLYKLAAEYALVAGEIDFSTLIKHISTKVSFDIPAIRPNKNKITEILIKRLENRLSAEKNSKKYIPEIFVEIMDIKDDLRLFCHPSLFIQKLIEDINSINLHEFNRCLKKVGLPSFAVSISEKVTFSSLDVSIKAIQNALIELTNFLNQFLSTNDTDFHKLVSRDKEYIINELIWNLNIISHGFVNYEIKDFQRRLDVVSSKVLCIVSKAGQGKTNFVCNLAESFLIPHGIPCAFFTGKELGVVERKQLQGFLVRTVYGEEKTTSFEEFIKDIIQIASKRDIPAIIIIDAINEHPDLPIFSQEIEELIEKCLEFSGIRIILTCRSEYFETRFGNLLRNSFSDRLVVKQEIHLNMSPEHRRRLIEGYFNFFKLTINGMAKKVREQIGEDPFLLRMLCEAYGNPKSKEVRKMRSLQNIRRDALFREYFKQKFNTLKEKTGLKTGFLLGNTHPYQELIIKIIDWMIEKNQYADIPITSFIGNNLATLSELVDEDILVRRDLKIDSVIGNTEVLNFTFDACRDFLLSDYLVNILAHEDRQKFEELVIRLTNPQNTVAEGLEQYLFYASRYHENQSIITFIERQPWYEDNYLFFIFDVDDKYITKKDSDKLKKMCLDGHKSAPYIIVNFLVRYDIKQHPQANALIAYELFDEINDYQFGKICNITFGDLKKKKGYYPIDKLTNDISKFILSTGPNWHSSYSSLARLLLYLWDIPGENYNYPSRKLFDKFVTVHNNIASQLLKEHQNENRKGFSYTKRITCLFETNG